MSPILKYIIISINFVRTKFNLFGTPPSKDCSGSIGLINDQGISKQMMHSKYLMTSLSICELLNFGFLLTAIILNNFILNHIKSFIYKKINFNNLGNKYTD